MSTLPTRLGESSTPELMALARWPLLGALTVVALSLLPVSGNVDGVPPDIMTAYQVALTHYVDDGCAQAKHDLERVTLQMAVYR